jgi:hypothetical protein
MWKSGAAQSKNARVEKRMQVSVKVAAQPAALVKKT